MPIGRICSSCNKRVASGLECRCRKQRYKEEDKYNKEDRYKKFYKTANWLKVRDRAVAVYNGMDIYSYYVSGVIEYGCTMHHIDPIKEDWSRRLDVHNLIYLSNSNHQLIHAAMLKDSEETKKLLHGLVGRWKEEMFCSG